MTSLPVTSPSRDDPRLERGFPLLTAREECMKKTQGGDSNYSITESSPYPKSSVCRAGEEWFGVNDPCPSLSRWKAKHKLFWRDATPPEEFFFLCGFRDGNRFMATNRWTDVPPNHPREEGSRTNFGCGRTAAAAAVRLKVLLRLRLQFNSNKLF